MNVELYLDRIGYKGSREPTIPTLKSLCYCHKTTILFSNLQVFGGEKIKLDLEKIFKKVIVDKNGGICYELNGLFVWLLRQLGFKAYQAQTKNYDKKTNTYSWPCFHSFPVIDFGNKGKYLCDPGYFLFGPAKLESMTPHVETHNIIRFRSIPDEPNWYIVERHRKSVLDAKGNLLKQGPAPPGVTSGICNEECRKQNSSHWMIEMKLCSEPLELEDFEEACDIHQNDQHGLVMSNLVVFIYSDKITRTIFGTTCYIKESINPVVDKILEEREIKSNEDIYDMARDVFGFEVKHKVNFFN